MIEIITNPVTIGVVVMLALCMIKVNVIISLLISAFLIGLMGGMGAGDIMNTIIGGLNGNGTNALAYLLLAAVSGSCCSLW